MRKLDRGYLSLLITFFIWGSLYIVSKYALTTVPPFTVLLLRYAGAALVLAPMLAKSGFQRIRKADVKYFFAVGVLGYFAAVGCQLISIRYMEGAVSSLLNAMNPVFITAMAAVVLKEPLSRRRCLAIVLAVVGACVVLGGKGGSLRPIGLVAALTNLVLWSLSSVLIRKVSAGYSPVQIAFCGIVLALVCCIPASVIELQREFCHFTIEAIAAIAYMAVVATGVAHALWNYSLSRLDAGLCSMFYPLQPLVSAVLGFFLLEETLDVTFFLGGLLITGGIVLGIRGGSTAKKA